MLTSKSSAPAKPRAKSTSKSAAYAVSSNESATLQVAQNMAVYTTREQRLRSERSKFSGLLVQRGATSDMDVVKLVHNRLSVNVIDRLLAEGVTKQEINLITPPRTLAHRRANFLGVGFKRKVPSVEEADLGVREVAPERFGNRLHCSSQGVQVL